MTHAEQIMQAVAALVLQDGVRVFSRDQVRRRAGVDSHAWQSSYNPTFQGMRADQPGLAPVPCKELRGVFRRLRRGQYELTERGWQVVRTLPSMPPRPDGDLQPGKRHRARRPSASHRDEGDALPAVSSHLIPSAQELAWACDLYQQKEQRDPMYRVATTWLETHWTQADRMADGLGVLLLTWNQAFYRFGVFSFQELQECLERNLDLLDRLRLRDIGDFTAEDAGPTMLLFEDFAAALRIASGKAQGRQSPIAVGKALHLLAPAFFPIWDRAIAKECGCSPGRHPARSYVRFCRVVRHVVDRLRQELGPTGRPLLKMLDEYYYVKFTKRWL